MDTEAGPEEVPESIQLPLVWVTPEDLVIHLGNQFLVQFDSEFFYLSVGQVAPPTFLGTPEERFEQARALQFVPVRTLGRYSLSRQNVQQLKDLLDQMMGNFDEQTRQEETG